MSQLLECPHCRGAVQSVPELAGQMFSCPHCGGQFLMAAATPTLPIPQAPPSPLSTPHPSPPRRRKRRQSKSSSMAWIISGSVFGVILIVVIVIVSLQFGGGESGDSDPFFKPDVDLAKKQFEKEYSGRMPENIQWKVNPLYVAVYKTTGVDQQDGQVYEGVSTREVESRSEAIAKASERVEPGETKTLKSLHRIGTIVRASWEFDGRDHRRVATQTIRVAVQGYQVTNDRFDRGDEKKVQLNRYRSSRK